MMYVGRHQKGSLRFCAALNLGCFDDSAFAIAMVPG